MTDPTFPIVVTEFRRSDREVIRVTLQEFRGHPLIAIRGWFYDSAGVLKPGRDGINLSIRHLPSLAAGIDAALARAKAEGLIES